MRGIDRDKGCLVIVRPDGTAVQILPMEARAEITRFFENIFTLAE